MVMKGEKMATRVIVSLGIVVAIVLTLVPNADAGGILPLVLVLLGFAYAGLEVSVGDATDTAAYLVLAIAGGAAAQADVLSHIPGIGAHLDAILDHLTTALYAGVAAVLAMRAFKRIKG